MKKKLVRVFVTILPLEISPSAVIRTLWSVTFSCINNRVVLVFADWTYKVCTSKWKLKETEIVERGVGVTVLLFLHFCLELFREFICYLDVFFRVAYQIPLVSLSPWLRVYNDFMFHIHLSITNLNQSYDWLLMFYRNINGEWNISFEKKNSKRNFFLATNSFNLDGILLT